MDIFRHLTFDDVWKVIYKRPLIKEEKQAIIKAKIVLSQYGKSVRFYRRGNKSVYIPLLGNSSDVPVGKKLNLNKIAITSLGSEGYKDIYRIELK